LAEDDLRLLQLGAVEAPLDGVVVVVDDLQGLIPPRLGCDQLLDQLLMARRVPGDRVAADTDPPLCARQGLGDVVLALQQLPQFGRASGMPALRSRVSPPGTLRCSSARRATAGSSIQSRASAWAKTSRTVCSPSVTTKASLLCRPRVMGTYTPRVSAGPSRSRSDRSTVRPWLAWLVWA
jgi:hypothetical protein